VTICPDETDRTAPALRKAGVSEAQIAQMLVENLRAIFEASTAR
jgi:predicted metal-dependent phosphotriesterase family hydrolase